MYPAPTLLPITSSLWLLLPTCACHAGVVPVDSAAILRSVTLQMSNNICWYHHFGIQNTQAWWNHPIQPSLLALELATSCPPLDHICQVPPPEPCGPAPLLTQCQACGRTWRSRSTPSLRVLAGGDASSPGSRCCLPRWYRRELVEGYPGHVSWSAERPAPALIAG